MHKLLSTLIILILGLVALSVAGPALAKLISALIPLVLVVGVVIAVLRWVWWYTR